MDNIVARRTLFLHSKAAPCARRVIVTLTLVVALLTNSAGTKRTSRSYRRCRSSGRTQCKSHDLLATRLIMAYAYRV